MERRQFEAKDDALGRAVDDFTRTYDAGRGHVWPQKEANALAKALQELEDVATWRQIVRRKR